MKRIAFIDWLRAIAIFMVMVVHSCECFYFDADGNTCFRSAGDALWVSLIDSAVRASVPLFVMASAYLLFPLKADMTTGAFFRRRLVRVGIPFVVWACAYNAVNGGDWRQMLFNFPATTGGHLWFVPMLFGLYLLMPLLSPWAERARAREVRGWLAVWLVTTTFPFLRKAWGALFGAPAFGSVPFLYGECPWNAFGTFQYVSGFFGYLLLGFYFRKFAPVFSWGRTLAYALPLWLVGYAISAGCFYFRIPFDGTFPLVRPYAEAVNLEMSWEFCSTGVALTVFAYFLVLRKLTGEGAFYTRVIRPLALASFGTYLMHMFVLPRYATFFGAFPTPVVIGLTAIATYLTVSALSLALRRIPAIGRYLVG